MTDCSYCVEGYFQDLTVEEIQQGKIANDVKCDHCRGTAICPSNCKDCEWVHKELSA